MNNRIIHPVKPGITYSMYLIDLKKKERSKERNRRIQKAKFERRMYKMYRDSYGFKAEEFGKALKVAGLILADVFKPVIEAMNDALEWFGQAYHEAKIRAYNEKFFMPIGGHDIPLCGYSISGSVIHEEDKIPPKVKRYVKGRLRGNLNKQEVKNGLTHKKYLKLTAMTKRNDF